MKKIICNIILKIIHKWELIALKNGFSDQVTECVLIQEKIINYKKAMVEKGIWK